MSTIQLDVVTPSGPIIRTRVDQVDAPSILGEFGVLPGHIPFLATLKAGVVRYRSEGKIGVIAVGSGFIETAEDIVTILAETAIQGEKVKVSEVKTQRDEAIKQTDTFQGEPASLEYEELVRRRDWLNAQLDAAKEAGNTNS